MADGRTWRPLRPLSPGESKGKPPRDVAWAVVLGAYLCVFGALLAWTRGVPYPIDNNESFSSLWHARHMYELGFSETKGLADEVMAWHPAANPYVHTHQGNFPRLFTFALYLLGARSIESQIILATFTVGLAAVWLAYRFLRSIGPPRFAAACCLVLITDYALFGQWQVNTYRVWYAFFFFSTLYWVSRLGRRAGWPMLLAGAALFSAVFYGEYVFAAFVGMTACGYSLCLYPRRPAQVARTCFAVGLGGAAAAGVLLCQLVAYMGWPSVKLDISYTLAARNMARDPAFADKVDAFYRDHRIIFWNNYFDVTNFRTIRTFVTSLFEKHLQYYTPWICLSALVILAGALVGLCRRDDEAPGRGAGRARPLVSKALPAAAVVALSWAALRFVRPLFNESSGTLWRAALGLPPPAWLGGAAYAVACALALVLAIRGTRRVLGPETGLGGLLALSLCVFAAYGAVYRVFTGYIFSGYLNRQAPFLVFLTDIVLGGALYVVLESTLRAAAAAAARRAPAFLAVAGTFLLLLFAVAWATMQASYLVVVPPDGEPFLKLLSRAPFRGATFVASDYPAPVSEKTHAWAYADSSIFSGQVALGRDGFSVEHDTHYLWFADALQNSAYLEPEYGILINQPASISEALTKFTQRAAQHEHAIAFDTVGIIKRTQEPLQPFLVEKLAATDGRAYSIVKFDWDYPPYLRPVDQAMRAAARSMTFEQKLAFSETSQEQRRRWRIQIEPTWPPAPGAGGSGPVQLTEASVDGRPVFTDLVLAAAGWSASRPAHAGAGRSWTGRPGTAGGLEAVVVGDIVTLRLLAGPGMGWATVGVDDMTQAIDLGQPAFAERVISLNTAAARDKYTAIPRLAPGTFVNTWLTAGSDGPAAVLGYAYAQQKGRPEEGTTVRVYNEPAPGDWRLADTIVFLGTEGIPVRPDEFRRGNPDTLSEYERMRGHGETRSYLQWLADHLTANPGDRNRIGILDAVPAAAPAALGAGTSTEFRKVPLDPGLEGRIQISVTPSTRTKAGPEFFGQIFDARRVAAARTDRIDPVQIETPPGFAPKDLPYGYISLRLRFPTDQTLQAEPIVTAGVEEAGDFIYVIYPDSGHIRIGFDHWFKSGPLSPPIPIDYAREHDVEISMGSLFPPEDDIIFVGMSPKAVAELKGNMWVKLDGKTVLQAPSEFWDSPPTQVAVGRNDIKGTTSNTRFKGEILSCKRIWPDLK